MNIHHDQAIDDFLGSVTVFSTAVRELLEGELRVVSNNRITFNQIKLLSLIARTDGHTIGEVATFLGVSNAAASKAVDRLVRRQLLSREEAKADRRAVDVSLTEAGSQLLANFETAVRSSLRAIFTSVSPDRLSDTAKLLDRLSVTTVGRQRGKKDEVCFRCGIHFRDRCLLRQMTGRECYFHQHKKRAS
jgi:DNA-binding MarR family transcriptional regulator